MNLDRIAATTTDALCEKHQIDGGKLMKPITHPTAGMAYNWANWVPPRIQDSGVSTVSDLQTWFNKRSQEGETWMAVAEMAEYAVAGWMADDNYPESTPLADWNKQAVLDFVWEIISRRVLGMIGEVYTAENIVNGKILPERDDDENRGIDIRTASATYQVKTTGQFGNENPSEDCEADWLVVVKVNDGEVVDFRKEEL